MNKFILKIFVGLVAIALSCCAAFFSIAGLAKLFAGASVAVIVMASVLEASKLITASFLYQHWKTVSKTLKVYLLIAMVIIAAITSLGIYGFLSSAYQDTKSKYDLTQTQTDSLSTQKMYFESSVENFKVQLNTKSSQLSNLTNIRNSQELRATQLVTTNRSSLSADRSAKQTDLAIKTINLEIDSLNKKIIAFSDSASKIAVAVKQLSLKNELSSELGSLVYVSNVLNVPMDKVVNILIILFIIVFDPLAICMVLAFNYLNESKQETEVQKEEITKESIKSKEYITIPNETLFTNDDMTISSDKTTTEQPTEQPRIQSETSTMDPNTQDNESLVKQKETKVDLSQKRMEKQEKAKALYTGKVSV
jgi:hypothetical protein